MRGDLGDGAPLVEGVLDDDAIALQDGEALGAGEDGDIDAAGVQAGGADRAVSARADHENSGLVAFHVS
jgi:hypothetical protein